MITNSKLDNHISCWRHLQKRICFGKKYKKAEKKLKLSRMKN